MDLMPPRQQAADRRQELAIQNLAKGIAAHNAARLDRHIDERGPRLLRKLRQRTIYMESVVAVRRLLESRKHDRAIGALERLSKDWSEAAFEGELKSISNRISLAPASRSLSMRSACSIRGHGQTPISRIDGESIATRTMSPLAWRGRSETAGRSAHPAARRAARSGAPAQAGMQQECAVDIASRLCPRPSSCCVSDRRRASPAPPMGQRRMTATRRYSVTIPDRPVAAAAVCGTQWSWRRVRRSQRERRATTRRHHSC